MRRGTSVWLGTWAVLTVLVIAAFRGVDWGQVVRLAESADAYWLAIAVLGNTTILLLGAWFWMWLLPRNKPVRIGPMLWITAVTSTVSNGGPFLAGHAAGIHLLATRGGVGYATALSVKALDQLIEGIAKLTLAGVALALAPIPGTIKTGGLGLLIALPPLALGLLVAAHRGHHLDALASETQGRRSRLLTFLAEVARQLEALRDVRLFGVGVLLGLAQKAAEGFALASVLFALDVHVPFWGLLTVLAAVNLSTMASLTPANLGVYEASAVGAYVLAGVEPSSALGIAILQHAAYLIPMAGVGWIMLARDGLRARSTSEDPAGSSG